MKTTIYLIIFLPAIFICGCDNYRFNNIIGDYYLVQSESIPKEYRLHYKYKEGYPCVIGTNVVAIGFDDNYILVEQDSAKIINYFIITHPLKTKILVSDIEFKIGPLNKVEFKNKRKELSVPDTLSLYNID